ncbi:MAG TPA: hypothetical protein VG146_20610 [Verrucomicrobiae bacterium]|nr:hypothetical protein [Verrucomicrobiae bacterium]
MDDMLKGGNQRAGKTDKLLTKVLGHRFTFDGGQADLKLLRSIHAGTYANRKPGDPSFHAYAAALNMANDFASQVLVILDLVPFNNQLADLQDKYMPSYPPMSPVTSAFFAGWMVLDAQDGYSGATLGELFVHYIQHAGEYEYVQKAMAALNDSYCSFYEVMDVGAPGLKLWDIAGKR